MTMSQQTMAAFQTLFASMVADVVAVRGVGGEVSECVGKVVVGESEVGGGVVVGGVCESVGGVSEECVDRVFVCHGDGGVEQRIVFGDAVEVVKRGSVSGESAGSSGSRVSWADEVADADRAERDVAEEVVVPELRPMAVVHGDGPKLLRRMLRAAGIRVPRAMERDLAIACYSRGAMPGVLHGAGDRLRVLAQVGDAALKLCTVATMARKSGAMSAKNVSDEVSVKLSNTQLAARGREAGFSGCYAYSEPGISDTMMATMVEAVVGAAYLHTSLDNVYTLAGWLEVSS